DVLWKHSVTSAVAASALAIRIGETEAVAFTAGLLHDVGKLILATVEPQGYSNLLKQHGMSGNELANAEATTFGITHADVGSRLLTRWGLPPQVAVAVQYHHVSPASATSHERLAAIVHLANLLAHHSAEGADSTLDVASIGPNVLQLAEVEPDDVP